MKRVRRVAAELFSDNIETILWILFYVFSNSIIQSLCYQSQKRNCPYYPIEFDKNIF